ncbi:MAG TPA: response regulator [Gemmatimonadales bacterium]|nr:response regulator [Gemmatimonadales bacterium]
MADRRDTRILLVDDDPGMARLIGRLLPQHGFGPLAHLTSGHEALAAADEYDILLLDHQLPDVSGLEVLRTLRARAARPAVVLITAHGTESLAAAALRLGADDYLIKDPSLPELLPEVLERVRRTRALARALAAAERELVRAERLAAVGEMTITLSHELNNPLAAAAMNVELLRQSGGLDPEQRASLEGVREALGRIRDILRRAAELREARRADYLPGLPMIDLSREAPAAPAYRGTVVLFVADDDLARVIALLLRHEGFTVERAASLDQAQASARRPGVTLVILGADGVDGSPFGGFRPDPDRSYALVALAAGDPGPARAAGADHVVRLPFDPATVAAELIAVLPR